MTAQTMNTNAMYMTSSSVAVSNPATSPLLGIWKADVVASLMGALVFACFAVFARTIDPMISVFAVGAYLIAELAYIARVYPSYFTDKPASTSCVSISFLNMFFGGIVFGCLWNRSLSRKEKGVSHIVRAILAAALFVGIMCL